jgi:DNA polymerase-3 subunit epsilon
VRLPAVSARRLAHDPGAAAYADAHFPPPRTPWRDARWCAVDFELTGLDPRRDEIISFGVIPIEDGRVQLGQAVSSLVRPMRGLHEAAIPVHGIRVADLAGAPSLTEALAGERGLIHPLTGRGLVFHVAAVDRPFLKRALQDHGLRLRGPTVDTEVLGRLWLSERDGRLTRRLGLGELASALGLPEEHPHDALGDALTTAQVFIALAAHLGARRPETVGSLVRAPQRLDAARMFEHHAQA